MLPWKMVAEKEPCGIIGDLSHLTKVINMKSTVPYLPDTLGIDKILFEQHPLSDQYYLDMIHCVTKRKHFNVFCLYDSFAEYCDLNGKEVKARLLEELDSNIVWYTKASAACLGMRGVTYNDWLKKLKWP